VLFIPFYLHISPFEVGEFTQKLLLVFGSWLSVSWWRCWFEGRYVWDRQLM